MVYVSFIRCFSWPFPMQKELCVYLGIRGTYCWRPAAATTQYGSPTVLIRKMGTANVHWLSNPFRIVLIPEGPGGDGDCYLATQPNGTIHPQSRAVGDRCSSSSYAMASHCTNQVSTYFVEYIDLNLLQYLPSISRDFE